MQPASLLRELACRMPGITRCYLGDIPGFTQPKLVLDLATPDGCKAETTWWLVKHRDGLPVQRRSPIPVLTGFDVQQVR